MYTYMPLISENMFTDWRDIVFEIVEFVNRWRTSLVRLVIRYHAKDKAWYRKKSPVHRISPGPKEKLIKDSHILERGQHLGGI